MLSYICMFLCSFYLYPISIFNIFFLVFFSLFFIDSPNIRPFTACYCALSTSIWAVLYHQIVDWFHQAMNWNSLALFQSFHNEKSVPKHLILRWNNNFVEWRRSILIVMSNNVRTHASTFMFWIQLQKNKKTHNNFYFWHFSLSRSIVLLCMYVCIACMWEYVL